jgi:uncharacterized protein (TIGR00251 family)
VATYSFLTRRLAVAPTSIKKTGLSTNGFSGIPMLKIDEDKSGVKFNLYVQPRSSRNQVVGLHGNALKVKIKAPPVEGAANKMCIAVLAKALNVPKSAIELVSGKTARTKRLLVKIAGNDDADKEVTRIKTTLRSLGSV